MHQIIKKNAAQSNVRSLNKGFRLASLSLLIASTFAVTNAQAEEAEVIRLEGQDRVTLNDLAHLVAADPHIAGGLSDAAAGNIADGILATPGAILTTVNNGLIKLDNASRDASASKAAIIDFTKSAAGTNLLTAEASGQDSAAFGRGAIASGDGSTAIGVQSTASADEATALGSGAKASGVDSTALGHAAEATADNSVALGSNSLADEANTVSVGRAEVKDKDGKITAKAEQRRLVNLADGIKASDAATVGQSQRYTDQKVGALRSDMNKMNKDLSRGIASVAAMANIPMAYKDGRVTVGAGVGYYNKATALAVKVGYAMGDTSFGGGIAMAVGATSPVIGVGISHTF